MDHRSIARCHRPPRQLRNPAGPDLRTCPASVPAIMRWDQDPPPAASRFAQRPASPHSLIAGVKMPKSSPPQHRSAWNANAPARRAAFVSGRKRVWHAHRSIRPVRGDSSPREDNNRVSASIERCAVCPNCRRLHRGGRVDRTAPCRTAIGHCACRCQQAAAEHPPHRGRRYGLRRARLSGLERHPHAAYRFNRATTASALRTAMSPAPFAVPRGPAS